MVRDDHISHRVWRLAQIKELIFSKDGLARSASLSLLLA